MNADLETRINLKIQELSRALTDMFIRSGNPKHVIHLMDQQTNQPACNPTLVDVPMHWRDTSCPHCRKILADYNAKPFYQGGSR